MKNNKKLIVRFLIVSLIFTIQSCNNTSDEVQQDVGMIQDVIKIQDIYDTYHYPDASDIRSDVIEDLDKVDVENDVYIEDIPNTDNVYDVHDNKDDIEEFNDTLLDYTDVGNLVDSTEDVLGEDISDVYVPQTVTVYFEEDTETVFPNPGMGWQTFHRFIENDQNLEGLPTTTMYGRYTWQDFEPQEGNFNFSFFDNLLTRAKNNGQRIAFRLMVSASGQTSSNTPNLGYAPLWLIDKGASGWIYYYDGNDNKKQDEGETDVWSPDLADPVARSYHDRLVNELSKRYNGHPYLDLIDIGSVGLWGEWHFYAARIKRIVGNPPTGGSVGSTIPMYSEQTRKEIIDLWREKFDKHPKTMLIGDLVGLSYVVGKGDSGWRADCWGDMNWHMPRFYDNQLSRANATNIWINGPVALETCWTMQYWYDKGWDIDYILKWAEEHHATYIQNKSAKIPDGWVGKVRESLKKIGYRLYLKNLQYPEFLSRGNTNLLSVELENKGVAPPYFDYSFYVKLQKVSGNLIIRWTSDKLFTVKGFLPGTMSRPIQLEIPKDIPEGEYELFISIRDPEQKYEHPNLKFIRLAIKDKPDGDGWYKVSKVLVK
ncbi:MAG: DUF4832 domain-containing protein [Deltaproteobacteria bacterium]|nr:DUF4832 domain-containing protein [Deltaproteobacteria bacterium]